MKRTARFISLLVENGKFITLLMKGNFLKDTNEVRSISWLLLISFSVLFFFFSVRFFFFFTSPSLPFLFLFSDEKDPRSFDVLLRMGNSTDGRYFENVLRPVFEISSYRVYWFPVYKSGVIPFLFSWKMVRF